MNSSEIKVDKEHQDHEIRHNSVIHLHFKSFKVYVKNYPSPKTKNVPKVMNKMEQLETLVLKCDDQLTIVVQ